MPGITQQEFLARVRAARGHESVHWTHDNPALGDPKPPEIADPISHFLERARNARMHPRRVATKEAAADAVVEILAQKPVQRLIRWSDPVLDALQVDDRLRKAGIEVVRWGDLTDAGKARETAFTSQAGIGSADLAIAETGSLLVGAEPGRGRGVSLCPATYIAVVPVDRVVRHLSQALAHVSQRLATAGRGQFVFVTGPSRTADIEMNLVTGVHGPEFVHIILLG